MGRTEFILEVAGADVARILVPPGKLEHCRKTAIEAANASAT